MDGLTPFTGTFDDLQREKRMANYQRSFMLPDVRQQVLVQEALTANPYNYDAALDMERFNADSQSIAGNTRRAHDMAAKRFVQEAQRELQQRQLRASNAVAPQPSSLITAAGNINGQEVMVPTAGNYMNGAYAAQMQRLGLGESPSVDAYRAAVENYVSPEQKQALKLQELENQGFYNKALVDALGKMLPGGGKPKEPKPSTKDPLAAPHKELNKLGEGYSQYRDSLLKMAPKPQNGLAVEPGDDAYKAYLAALTSGGIPYSVGSDGRVAVVPIHEWAAKDPGARALINGLTRTPEGAQAYSQYANAMYAQPGTSVASSAPAAAPPAAPRVNAAGKKAASGPKKGSVAAAPTSDKQRVAAFNEIGPQEFDRRVEKFLADGYSENEILLDTPKELLPQVAQSIARINASKARFANASQGFGYK